MKLSFCIFLFLWVQTLGFCQFNTTLDVLVGPEYSYRFLTGPKNSLLISSRNEGDSGRLNWRFGFNFNQRLNQKLVLKTGLRLAFIGYKGENKTGLKWGSEHDGMGGWTPDPTLPHEIQGNYNHWFIEVPIVGRYEFENEKFTPFIEVGLSPYYYLTTKRHIITDIYESTSFERNDFKDFKKIHLVASISCGVNYNLNETTQLFGQPIFRYHLTRLVGGSTLGEYLFNAGVEVGVRKRIGR